MYHAGERHLLEASASRGEPIGAPSSSANPYLATLQAALEPLHRSGQLDCLCLYAYGVILKGLGIDSKAQDILLEAVRAWPVLWAAWAELARGCISQADAASLRSSASRLPDHWCSQLFEAECQLAMQQGDLALDILEEATAGVFEQSVWVRERLARAHAASTVRGEGRGAIRNTYASRLPRPSNVQLPFPTLSHSLPHPVQLPPQTSIERRKSSKAYDRPIRSDWMASMGSVTCCLSSVMKPSSLDWPSAPWRSTDSGWRHAASWATYTGKRMSMSMRRRRRRRRRRRKKQGRQVFCRRLIAAWLRAALQ